MNNRWETHPKAIFETLKLSRMGTMGAVRQETCFDGLCGMVLNVSGL